MKKLFNKNLLLGILIGAVCTSGIGVYAVTLFNSGQVSYKSDKPEITTVDSAIQDLYNITSESSGGVTSLAKDANGNNAEAHYYGGRITTTTKTFKLNKGEYTLFMFTTYNDIYSATATGGDTTPNCTVSGGTITKINDYCYKVEIPTDGTNVNVTINSYGTNEDRRTIYGIYFYN